MTGVPLIITFVLAIVVMIVAISKFKVHPFLSIMSVSLILALLAGIPLGDIANVIGAGFSGTFSSIGIVIILGALIGTVLEQTGAALKLADMVVKLVGQKNPELAIELMGWVVSIPVFCDSGFVILDPIRRAMVRRTKTSSVAMTVALSAGLYISHVFIPPTPGPIAAANTLGIQVSLPAAIVLSAMSALGACGASGVAGGSLLLIPMACSLFGISNDVAMQMVGVGFIIGVVQDSVETALNSAGDVEFAATAEYHQWLKQGKALPGFLHA